MTDSLAASLEALRRLAATIGADPRLVQGAGGNVSIKVGDTMWIKASGTWLADAERRDIMVPVALPPDLAGEFVVRERHTTGLRPSIETSMHALLPHAVVLHVHNVDAIALAGRQDAAELLGEKLDDLRWTFVPYRRPGLPLTRAITEVAPEGAVDVLVLGNHGLVVAAHDVAAAEALLTDVVARLSGKPRAAPPGSAAITSGHGFHPCADPVTHSLATDPASMVIAEGGVLYPDHVVFLGRTPLVIDPDDDFGVALTRRASAGHPRPRWAIIRGLGVAIADDIARGGEEMLRCLADVAARIPAGAALSFLDKADLSALTDWDAEQYRQRLAQAAA